LFVDGYLNKSGGRLGVMLEGLGSLRIEQSLRFNFKASNNQAEYEVLIARLLLVKIMGAQKVECKTDSRVMVGHINGEYQVKDPLFLKYYHWVSDIMAKFEGVKMQHIKLVKNSRADISLKLASSK